MRQFIRHPIDFPVEIGLHDGAAASSLHTSDISEGGLALHSEVYVSQGVHVQIRIAHVQPPFEAQARVAWCQRAALDGYDVGVTFLDAEAAFRARMVEQVCHIEDYRRSVGREEGRVLSAEEAAEEWISRHAAQFPPIGHARSAAGPR